MELLMELPYFTTKLKDRDWFLRALDHTQFILFAKSIYQLGRLLRYDLKL